MRIHSPQITGSAENTNIVTTTRITSLTALSASFASTASFANNFTVGGTLTAQTINVQTITSSVDYVTGSSINGSLLANTHQFTGSVGITGSLTVNNNLLVTGSVTAVGAIARSIYNNPTLVAAANSDVLVGLDIQPTFTNGAFTGVSNIGLRVGSVSIGRNGNGDFISFGNQATLARNNEIVFSGLSTGTTVSSRSPTTPVIFTLNQTITPVGQFYGTTGNFALQNGGTFTDNGYRLQVNGSGSASGSLFVSGSSVFSGSVTSTVGFTGSLQGTASFATSASFALTASYISGSGGGVGFPFSGSAIITGSLFVSGSTISGSFVGDGSGITGLTAGGKIHTQSSAASTWIVTHNLGVQYPNVTVYDDNNNVIIPQTIVATDANTLTLTFGSAVAGYAVAGIGGIINVQGRTTQQYFTASTTWSFAHNLGDRYVSLQAFDDAFEMMIPTTIRLVDFTSSLMLFDSASSGYAVATIGGDLPAISSSYAGYTLQVANSAPYSASWVAAANVAVTTAVSSSFAATASSADNLTVRGTLTAQTINVQTITSSIEFITGSTRNGTLLTNTHEFTGSVLMSGSVGIGTNTLTFGQLINKQKSDSVTPYYNGLVNMAQSNSSYLSMYYDGSVHVIGASYGSQGDGGAYKPITFQTSDVERIRITTSGNVGIGTSNPFSDTNFVSTYIGGTSGGQLILGYTAGGAGNRLLLLQGDSGASSILSVGARPLDFYTNGSLRMSIASGGNVGIGTNSPDGKLTVVQESAASVTTLFGNGNSQGSASNIKIVRHYPVVSSGNKLIIPFIDQGNLNSTTIVRIFGHAARFNSNVPLGFTADFGLGHLNQLLNLAVYNSTGNISGIAISGMNIEISFTTAYTASTANGLYATIEYMASTPSYSINVANIAMN
jgi:hypothetical protein